MSLASELAAYSAQVNADVSSQTDPNSIDPTTVGSIGIDLANIIEPYISASNNQTIYEGTSDPTSLPSFGADLDLYYYKQATFFALYRKEAGVWTVKTTVPFGVVLPNGPATLRTFIGGFAATVTSGGWFIANTVYNKATQTLFTVPAADTNFYRVDLIYANTSNQVLYLAGTAAATPVDPAVPLNAIAVDYVTVPSVSSGFEPYLRYGGSGVNNLGPDDVILNQSGSIQPLSSFNISGIAKIGGAVTLTGLPANASTDFNVTIDGSGNLRKSAAPVGSGLFAEATTGALTYLGITVVDGTHVTIGACTGYVVNNESTPASPSFTAINYAGETNKLVTTVGSGIATYVLLNAAGVVVFQNAFPTSAQRKTMIYLSKIGHPDGVITTVGNEVDFITSPLQQHRDLFQALNYINNGVQAGPAGATLNFALTTGVITGDGINFVTDNTNPNDYTVPPQPTASFLPRTQTGAGGGLISTVDVGNYDVAGTITAIPGGGNTSTLRYIFYVPPLGIIVQYGQMTYTSLVNAVAQVGKESFTIYPSLVRNAILVGVLAARKAATDLSNPSDALFFRADKFGQIIGAQAGVSIGTLQSSYNNSLQPQITTTAPLGAVQFKQGSGADTDNVFQGLNGAGTATFSVTGNGLTTAQGYNANGSFSAVANLARGNYFNPTLTATANNDVLIGLDIAPIFNPLSFNPVLNYGVRINGVFSNNIVTRNTASLSSSTIMIEDDAGTKSMLIGIRNTGNVSSGADFGVIGETFWRSSSNSLGLLLASANGRIRFMSITTEVMRIFTGGNLLLQNGGTFTDDGSRFQVNGIGNFKGGAEALKVSTATGNPDHAYMGFYARTASPTTQSGYMGYNGSGTNTLSIVNNINNSAINLTTTGTANILGGCQNFQVNPASGGGRSVLIGQVVGGGNINGIDIITGLASFAGGSKIRLRTHSGTTTIAATLNGNILGQYVLGGYVDTSTTNDSISIRGTATENWSSTAGGSKLEFYTTPNTTIAQVLALTIDQDGKTLFNAPLRRKNYTVSTLPAGVQGDTAYVTDALAPTYLGTAVGGGAVVAPVFYNGAAWITA